MLTFCCSTATIQFVENHRKKTKRFREPTRSRHEVLGRSRREARTLVPLFLPPISEPSRLQREQINHETYLWLFTSLIAVAFSLLVTFFLKCQPESALAQHTWKIHFWSFISFRGSVFKSFAYDDPSMWAKYLTTRSDSQLTFRNHMDWWAWRANKQIKISF